MLDTAPQWYSVLPPLMAVVLAFTTRKLLFSLGVAILLGGVLVAMEENRDNLLISAMTYTAGYLFDNITSDWNLKVLAFVIAILSMISVIIVAGGLKGIVSYLLPLAKTKRSTQIVTAITGLIVFIDDYANTMIIGSAMRPVTDRHNISREKLAFIIDATSAPVAGLAVISTWIGFEVGLFGEVSNTLNLGLDGYTMFFDAFGFRFYCILMLIFVFANIISKREFGAMYYAEQRVQSSGKLSADDAKFTASRAFSLTTPDDNSVISAKTALIPFAILFSVLLGGYWVDGNGLHLPASAIFSFSSWLTVISQIQNSANILLLSAFAGLLSSIVIALALAKTRVKHVLSAINTGTTSSFLPVLILLLAWSLKSVCDDLQTGEYVVTLLSPHLSPLWFPAILFFIAAITAFGTGTSWGTMSILIPITIPIAYALDGQSYGLITVICLGAVLDGAIFGDHCSPISDTTIMSSIAAHCDHLHHVKTQMPYSVFIATIALIAGYLPAAMGVTPLIAYAAGVLLLVAGLMYFGKKPPVTAKPLSE